MDSFDTRRFATIADVLAYLDETSPMTLKQGTNVLVFKVSNESMMWHGCIRLVDEDGKPVQGVQARLTP